MAESRRFPPRSWWIAKEKSRPCMLALPARMNLKMISKIFCLLLPLLPGSLLAQSSPLLNVTPPDQVVTKPGATVTVKVSAALSDGFHLNSHTPQETWLIPLTLKWTEGALESGEVQYPAPK